MQTLCHPNHEQLPDNIKWYAAAAYHFPDVWTSDVQVKCILTTQGHREFYISTVISYIASLRDLYHLLQIKVTTNQQVQILEHSLPNDCPLDPYQMAVAKHIQEALSLRKQFYQNHRLTTREDISDSDSNSDSDSDVDVSNDDSTDPAMTIPMDTSTTDASNIVLHWEKPI